MKLDHKNSNLTQQQQVFVAEYVIDFNQKRAALAAGYSEKSISALASHLLSNPKIQTAIDVALSDYGTEHKVLKQRVLAQLSNLAFSDMADYYEHAEGETLTLKDLKAMSRKQTSAIQEVKVKNTIHKGELVGQDITFKLCSKERALDMLGRHLGMFTDKVEVATDGPQGPVVTITLPSNGREVDVKS